MRIRTDRTQEQLRALLDAAGLQLPFLSSFYMGEPAPDSRLCVVVDYADADPDALEAGLAKLSQYSGCL